VNSAIVFDPLLATDRRGGRRKLRNELFTKDRYRVELYQTKPASWPLDQSSFHWNRV